MTASQTRIAETIDAFYGEAGNSDNVSAYYRQSVEDIDEETVKELVRNSTPIERNKPNKVGWTVSGMRTRSNQSILCIFCGYQ
jgi:hypothetical protein